VALQSNFSILPWLCWYPSCQSVGWPSGKVFSAGTSVDPVVPNLATILRVFGCCLAWAVFRTYSVVTAPSLSLFLQPNNPTHFHHPPPSLCQPAWFTASISHQWDLQFVQESAEAEGDGFASFLQMGCLLRISTLTGTAELSKEKTYEFVAAIRAFEARELKGFVTSWMDTWHTQLSLHSARPT